MKNEKKLRNEKRKIETEKWWTNDEEMELNYFEIFILLTAFN